MKNIRRSRKLRAAFLASGIGLLAALALFEAGASRSFAAQVIPTSGYAWPALQQTVDAAIKDAMARNNLPGMTVAVSRDGRLIMSKGFGYAKASERAIERIPMRMYHRSRIGSVTKAAITGPAAFRLMKDTNVNPALMRLYGPNGMLGTKYDSDIAIGVLRYTPIADLAINNQDRVHAWYRNGTFSVGSSKRLDRHQSPKPYKLPAGKKPVDIRAIGIVSHGQVVTLYDDLSFSVGTPDDLGRYSTSKEKAVKLPTGSAGKSVHQIVGMDFAKSNNRLYVWYDDGAVSSGTVQDLAQYSAPRAFQYPPSGYPFLIRGMGIAKNDHVYAWFGNSTASSGLSTKLHHYLALYPYTIPSGVSQPEWSAWYRQITIQNLLDHKGGFSRSGDTTGASKHFNIAASKLTYEDVHRHFLRTRKLLSQPGSSSSYSNHGFGLWTLLIEKMSGKPFWPYVRDHYLKPVGLHEDVVPERATADARDAWNHKYDDDRTVPIDFEQHGLGLAAGGFRSSAQNLLRLTINLEKSYTTAELDSMGWARNAKGKLGHSGKTTGGTAYVAMFPKGYVSSGGVDLGGIHVALLTNVRMKGADDEDDADPPPGLRNLADTIALAVPSSGVPETYDLWK